MTNSQASQEPRRKKGGAWQRGMQKKESQEGRSGQKWGASGCREESILFDYRRYRKAGGCVI